jgi:hypothetical protein
MKNTSKFGLPRDCWDDRQPVVTPEPSKMAVFDQAHRVAKVLGQRENQGLHYDDQRFSLHITADPAGPSVAVWCKDDTGAREHLVFLVNYRCSILHFEPNFSFGNTDWITDLYSLNKLATRKTTDDLDSEAWDMLEPLISDTPLGLAGR